ncbi:MAG: OmpA family protein [Saprospiraceae bacterium]|nr:OmpA family protein [Saprospiraceae bacterium]
MKKHLLTALFATALSNLAYAQEEKPAYHIFSIYFGGGSYYIDEEQIQELYKWLDGIPDIETQQISIHSHTDNIGSMEYNKMLSRYRSESALQQLLNKGIPHDIIDIADFGEESPIYNNDTWDGKLRNRRVDIIIKPLIM